MSTAASLNTGRDADDEALESLKAKMTEKQRLEMAELVQNELVRRESLKKESGMNTNMAQKSMIPTSRMSGGLSRDDLDDMYRSQDKEIQALRVRAVEDRLNQAKRENARINLLSSNMPAIALPKFNSKTPGVLFAVCLVVLAGAKIFSGISSLPANSVSGSSAQVATPAAPQQVVATNEIKQEAPRARLAEPQAPVVGDVSLEEVPLSGSSLSANYLDSSEDSIKQSILLQLDQRRVELEQRKVVLDEKERELKAQVQLISEKATELKSLIAKLSSIRKDKDQQYESRLEQLATVYSSMTPQEAAGLIARLDNVTAMGLLERMPGKRMAQILGVMDQERAIELTRSLTDKKKI
jgi:flagellar motility protein MotE (MotC chaperone)